MIFQIEKPDGTLQTINARNRNVVRSQNSFGGSGYWQTVDGIEFGNGTGLAQGGVYTMDPDTYTDNYIELPISSDEQYFDRSIPAESRDSNSVGSYTIPGAGSLRLAYFTFTEYEAGQPVTKYYANLPTLYNSRCDYAIPGVRQPRNNSKYTLSGLRRPRISFDIITIRRSGFTPRPDDPETDCLLVTVWIQQGDELVIAHQLFFSLSFLSGSEPIPGQTTTQTTTPEGGLGARINDSFSIPFPDLLTISQSSVIQPDPGSHGLHIYALTLGQFSDLYAEMWSTNLFRQLNNSKYTPMQGIGALHKMACSSPAEPTAYNIRLAGATLKTTGFICQTQFVESAVYSAQIPRYSGTFLDFAPHTQIMLHLPFIGTVSIDPDLVVGGGLQVKYIFDLLQGNCTATVRYYDRFGNDSVYGSYNGNCAYQCIVSGSDNGFPAVRGALQTFATGAVDFGSGNFAGAAAAAIAGGINIATAQHHFSRQGNSGGNSAAIGCTDLFVKITMPQDVDTTNIQGGQGNYRVNNLGYPAAGGGKVEDYTGHYVEAVVHADIPGATAAEKRRIEQAMSGGLFV